MRELRPQGNSGPRFSIQSPRGPSLGRELFLREGVVFWGGGGALLQTLRACPVVHLGAARGYKQHPHWPARPPAPALLGHWTCWVTGPAGSPAREQSSSHSSLARVLGPRRTGSLARGSEEQIQVRSRLPRRPKQPTRHRASLVVVGGARPNSTPFAFEVTSPRAPHHCAPKLLSDLFLTLWHARILPVSLEQLLLLPSRSDQHNVLHVRG